jgi:DNA polymerase-1
MILQVHDELVFEVPEQDCKAVAETVKRVMERAAEPLQLSVPLVVDVGIGKNWADAH